MANREWLQFYTEYDFPSSSLLDMRFTLKHSDALKLRVGQYKIFYNRERVDSSGKQQCSDTLADKEWSETGHHLLLTSLNFAACTDDVLSIYGY